MTWRELKEKMMEVGFREPNPVAFPGYDALVFGGIPSNGFAYKFTGELEETIPASFLKDEYEEMTTGRFKGDPGSEELAAILSVALAESGV